VAEGDLRGRRVLDVGCGTGQLALALVDRGAKVWGVDPSSEMLEQARSAAGRRVGGYSLGMRQRLALAHALLGDPGTLILDEPANGLDPDGVRWLRSLIRGLGAQGRTVLISSHVLAELAQSVDDIMVIEKGRLEAHGPMAGLTTGGETLEDAFLRLTATQGAS